MKSEDPSSHPNHAKFKIKKLFSRLLVDCAGLKYFVEPDCSHSLSLVVVVDQGKVRFVDDLANGRWAPNLS